MRQRSSGPPVLGVDVRALVEGYLRELACSGRMRELVRSRAALARHYRAEGNEAAVYCLASAPDFSLTATPGGGALLSLRSSGHSVSWTRQQLLAAAPAAAAQVESLAVALAGGPGRFEALSEGEREALTARAVDELIRRQRGG